MQWIIENHQLVTALTGLGTLVVWVVYLQVFVSSYHRQLRATLLITRGAGTGRDALCFLSNMSSDPVYISSVIVTVETAGETLVRPVTDRIDLEGRLLSDQVPPTRQGPLGPGAMRDIGTFEELIRSAWGSSTDSAAVAQASVRSVTVEVVGLYGPEDLPIGARRCFAIVKEQGRHAVRAAELRTEQIRSRRQRRALLDDLERDR